MDKYVARQKRRRKKMHSTRRKQETAGVLGLVGTLVLIPFGVSWWILSTLIVVFSAVTLASRATPPNAVSKPRRNGTANTAGKDARVRTGVVRVGVTGREKGNRRPCTAACQYSRKSRTTCDCSCGGQLHGISAPRGQAPKKKVARRKKKV